MASWRIAIICSSDIGRKGDAGCGYNSGCVSVVAASLDAYVDEVAGILHSCGRNTTVRANRSDLVLLT